MRFGRSRFRASLHVTVVTFGLLLVAGVWAAIAANLAYLKTQLLASAEHEAANLSYAFERHLIVSLRSFDHLLLLFKEAYERLDGDLDVALWCRSHAILVDHTLQFSVVDERGLLLQNNRGPASVALDLSDREHINRHFGRDDGIMFISKPVVGRISLQATVQLTRRLNKRDGTLAGVVIVSISPESLTGTRGSIDLGPQGLATVVGQDGVIRARATRDAVTAGESLSGTRLFREIQDRPHGTYRAQSALDGIERTFSYRSLTDYPLHINIGMDLAPRLALHQGTVRLYVAGAAGLTVLLGIVLWLFARQASEMELLNLRLRQQEAALVASRDAAEKTSLAKSHYLAAVSHELRTPLNMILGYSAMILDAAGSATDAPSATYRECATAIRDGGQSLLNIITDVLDMAKLDAGMMQLTDSLTDIAQIISLCRGSVAGQAETAQVSIIENLPEEIPLVRADGARLKQALLNIVRNAVKFTPPGGRVVLGAHMVDDGSVAITVADSGIGMSAEEIEVALQAYRQVDGSRTRRFLGAGLGLPITSMLVALHGGRLAISSTPGQGTTVTLSLPADRVVIAEAMLKAAS